jgi:dTDP-glucose pyrophosphorylase
MKNWERALVGPDTTLRDVLAAIDRAGSQLALVVDADRRLLGTVSDGDARRAFLRGLSLTDAARSAMHRTPTTATTSEDRDSLLGRMRALGLHQIPIIDDRGMVVGLERIDDLLAPRIRENWVVIMAGGVGKRLAELTKDTPKPMLKVGSRPILETVVRGYAEQGFHRFYLAVNYKAEQIEAHFGDGSALGVDVRYLREREPLGTAGALSLLPDESAEPIVVTNADLLTKEDYGRMVDRHIESGAIATMAVRDYEMQVPFGVVQQVDGAITSIEEKPVHRFVVSAGMYVLSPDCLRHVPQGRYFDMPSLFETVARAGLKTRGHHIDGYWLDIGRLSDYERANVDFTEVFR